MKLCSSNEVEVLNVISRAVQTKQLLEKMGSGLHVVVFIPCSALDTGLGALDVDTKAWTGSVSGIDQDGR